MIDLMLKLNKQFTEQDKEDCIPVVEYMMEIAEEARAGGILVLEGRINEEEPAFVAAGISLLTDGLATDDMEQILTAMIVSGSDTGSELLGKLIAAQGILMLNQGLNPNLIRRTLLAMLGEEYLARELKGGA
jgi:flagellar motor component MotA